jgi:AraC family transcriptional regulator
MGRRQPFPDSSVEVARLQRGTPPPFLPETFTGETRVTRLWSNTAFDAHVPGLREHVIVFGFRGFANPWTKTDGRILSAQSGPGSSDIDVALEVGHQTRSAFAAVFKHVVGTTPTAFRRSL